MDDARSFDAPVEEPDNEEDGDRHTDDDHRGVPGQVAVWGEYKCMREEMRILTAGEKSRLQGGSRTVTPSDRGTTPEKRYV